MAVGGALGAPVKVSGASLSSVNLSLERRVPAVTSERRALPPKVAAQDLRVLQNQ